MNVEAIKAIYFYEMARTRRTLLQSVVSPVVSTALYFIVFGAAVGSRMQEICGVAYAASSRPASSSDADLPVRDERVERIYFPKFTGPSLLGSLLSRSR